MIFEFIYDHSWGCTRWPGLEGADTDPRLTCWCLSEIVTLFRTAGGLFSPRECLCNFSSNEMRIISILTDRRTALPGPALAAGRTLLGDDVAADITSLHFSGANSLTLALGHSAEGWAALLMGNILEGIRCYR